jgi:hypothetical protein
VLGGEAVDKDCVNIWNRRRMLVPHEIHEHIEHAGHGEGAQGKLPQWIGITVAILGVLMALCSAQVGAARTELIATMVEENGAKTRFLSVANKYRSLQAQLQQLHAAMPDPEVLAKKDEQLKNLRGEVKNPDTLQGIRASELQIDKVLNTVTPTETDVVRFLSLLDRIREEAEAAKEWSESYHDAVEAHANTAERFEIALLAAEIGIVIASVGLLLAKPVAFARGAWSIAVVLGLVCLCIAGATKVVNTRTLHDAEQKIHTSEHHYTSMNKDEEDVVEDKKLEEDIRRDIKRLTAGS